MKRKRRRDAQKGYSRRAFIAKLRRLADALESGQRFTIQVAGERIRIPTHAAISIEHEREGDEEEIEFQLTWKRKHESTRSFERRFAFC